MDMEKDGGWWILKWLISRLINCVYVWGLRQDTGPTIDSHWGRLMTNILLHSARDTSCITSASYSRPASSYSLFLLRKTSLLSVPLSHTRTCAHTHSCCCTIKEDKAACTYFSCSSLQTQQCIALNFLVDSKRMVHWVVVCACCTWIMRMEMLVLCMKYDLECLNKSVWSCPEDRKTDRDTEMFLFPTLALSYITVPTSLISLWAQ